MDKLQFLLLNVFTHEQLAYIVEELMREGDRNTNCEVLRHCVLRRQQASNGDWPTSAENAYYSKVKGCTSAYVSAKHTRTQLRYYIFELLIEISKLKEDKKQRRRD